jgi:hypothetical protein
MIRPWWKVSYLDEEPRVDMFTLGMCRTLLETKCYNGSFWNRRVLANPPVSGFIALMEFIGFFDNRFRKDSAGFCNPHNRTQ